MSYAAIDGFLRKLRYTPARDLVRGRISGRLDLKATIAQSGLPAPAQQLIGRVVRRTRLWLLEKVEVAVELIAHFADGIESGRSVEDLIEKFGDELKAAKLIRRAKKRNRPLAWHVLRGLGWIIVVMLTVYGFLAARFVLGRPSPSVDYVAILNRPVLAAPEDQRAWPIYRQAILLIGEREKKEAVDRLNEVLDARPGSEHWAKVGPWLKEHQKVIELTRDGAQKPIVGFVLGKAGSINDPQVYPGRAEGWDPLAESSVVAVLLPHLGDVRLLASFLSMDARFAREQKDTARVMSDIEAMLKFSEQMHRDSGFVVVDLVALSLRDLALATVEEALLDEKLKLSDADLQKLAHLISRPKLAADLFNFAGERMMLMDTIQRSFTDGGDGGGHLTMEGERFFQRMGVIPKADSRGYGAALFEIFTLLTGPVAESRAEISRKVEGMMDLADANLRRPIREADWHTYQRTLYWRDQMERIREPVINLAPTGLNTIQERAEISLGHGDGIVVGIALELYRRKHGDYPAALGALMPEYLPQVPADRISGEPVKFKIVQGRPLIYSVGTDRDDDGGKPPKGKNSWFKAASWSVAKEQAANGDWLLFPRRNEPDP